MLTWALIEVIGKGTGAHARRTPALKTGPAAAQHVVLCEMKPLNL
jgi:hypothetical protein